MATDPITIISIIAAFLMIITIIILSLMLSSTKKKLKTSYDQQDQRRQSYNQSLAQVHADSNQKLKEMTEEKNALQTELNTCQNDLNECQTAQKNDEEEEVSDEESIDENAEETAVNNEKPDSVVASSIESFSNLTKKNVQLAGITLNSANINQWLMPANTNLKHDSWSVEYLDIANPKNYWNPTATHYNLYDAELARNLFHRYCDPMQINCDYPANLNDSDENINNMSTEKYQKMNTIIPDDIAKFEQLDVQ